MGSNGDYQFRVTLLGTGAPPPVMDRFGPSTLVEAGAQKYLIDGGRGSLQRLFQLGIPFKDIDGLFLTHLHSDHIVGIPDLWLTGRIGRPWGGRREVFRVWGPRGTREMMSHLEQAFEFDIRIRSHYYQSRGAEAVAEDFSEGVVMERDGLTITAFEVDHGPLVKPSYGFRIDYRGRCVVLSGDTCFNENLIRCSAGTDLLIHEVAAAEPGLLQTSQQIRTIMGNHTDPQQAGEVFSRVKPKLAVFTHILLFGDVTVRDVLALARKTYTGPMEIGEDLMTIELREGVRVRPFPSGRPSSG